MPEQYLGPYRLLSVLGHGRNTIVYKAWQQGVDRPVTLKVVSQPEPGALRRLQAEAQLTASLSDPRVRQVYEVGQTPEGQLYVALQYADYSLKDQLDARKAQHKPFNKDEVIEILSPIAEALDALHRRGLVHLDIKPENILLFKETRHVVLADLGIAQKIGATTQAGTPLYTSPEQAAGNRAVGPWSDVYSLGVVAYEMMAGRPPFKANIDVAVLRQHLEDAPPPLGKFRRDVEAGAQEAIARALVKDPLKRFAAAGEFIAALRQHQTPVSLALKRTGLLLRETPANLKRRPWLGMVVLLLAVAAAVVAGGLCLWPAVSAWVWRRPTATAIPTPPPMIASTVALTAAPSPSPTSTSAIVTPATTLIAPTATLIAPTATIIPTLTPLPTSRVTRAPTATPAITPAPSVAALYPAPFLDKPAAGASLGAGHSVSFTWSWGGRSLKSDERYRFIFLKGGQSLGQPSVSRDNWRDHAGPPAGAGTYDWCVDVVRVDQSGAVAQALSQPACRQVTWR